MSIDWGKVIKSAKPSKAPGIKIEVVAVGPNGEQVDMSAEAQTMVDDAMKRLRFEAMATTAGQEEASLAKRGTPVGSRVDCQPGGKGTYIGFRQMRNAPAEWSQEFENDYSIPNLDDKFLNPLIRLDSGGYTWGAACWWKTINDDEQQVQ